MEGEATAAARAAIDDAGSGAASQATRDDPQGTLSSNDVLEISRFSQGKVRIEELAKTLASRPEIDLLGNVRSAAGLEEAAVKTLAASIAEKQAELHTWKEERDSIEASMAEYNVEDMERLRELSAAASRRHMSRQDTDLIEVALETLVAFDALLGTLSTRRTALDIYGQRLAWEAARIEGWLAYLELSDHVAGFVEQRGRWSVAIYEVSSGRAPSRYALREKVELEVSRLRSRAEALSAGVVMRSGHLLDELIDMCKVPDELLDEQERLEDGVASLAPRLEFCAALFGQWKKADDAWFALQAVRSEAHSLLSEVVEGELEGELVSSCAARIDSVTAKLTAVLKRDPSRLLSSTSSSAPADLARRILRAPECAAFPDQPAHNAEIEARIAEEVGLAIVDVRESRAAVERQRKAWAAHQSLVSAVTQLTELTQAHTTTARLLRQGWGDLAIAGSALQEAPVALDSAESLGTARHERYLARLPTLSDEHAKRSQTTAAALQAVQRAILSCTANSAPTSVRGVPAEQAMVEAEEAKRGADAELKEVLAATEALTRARTAYDALGKASEDATSLKVRLGRACQEEAWSEQESGSAVDLLTLASDVAALHAHKATALSSSTSASRTIAGERALPGSGIVQALSTAQAALETEMEAVSPLLEWARVLQAQRLETTRALQAAHLCRNEGLALAEQLRADGTRTIDVAQTSDSLERAALQRKEAQLALSSTLAAWKARSEAALDGLATRVPLVGPAPVAVASASPDDAVRAAVNAASAALASLVDEAQRLEREGAARMAIEEAKLAELVTREGAARTAAEDVAQACDGLRAVTAEQEKELQAFVSSSKASSLRRLQEKATALIQPSLDALSAREEALSAALETLTSHPLVQSASAAVDRHDTVAAQAREARQDAQALISRIAHEVDQAQEREDEAQRQLEEAEARRRLDEEESIHRRMEEEQAAQKAALAEAEERRQQEAKAEEAARREADEAASREAEEAARRGAEETGMMEAQKAARIQAEEQAGQKQAKDVSKPGEGANDVNELRPDSESLADALEAPPEQQLPGQDADPHVHTTPPGDAGIATTSLAASPISAVAGNAHERPLDNGSRSQPSHAAVIPSDSPPTPRVIVTPQEPTSQGPRPTSEIDAAHSPATDVFGPVATQPKPSKPTAAIAGTVTKMRRLFESLQDDVVERQTIIDGLAQMRAYMELPTLAEAADVEQQWTAAQSDAQKVLADKSPADSAYGSLQDVPQRRAAKVRRFGQLARFAAAASVFEAQLSVEIEAIDAAAGTLDRESALLTQAAEEANAAADPVAQDARVRARITQLNRSRQDVEAMAREAMGEEPALPSTPSSYAASLASSDDGYSEANRTGGAATPAFSDCSEAASVSSVSASRRVDVDHSTADLPPLATPRKQQGSTAVPSSQSRRSVSEGSTTGIPSLRTPRMAPRSVTPSAIPRSPRTPRASTMAPPLATPTLLTPGQRRLPSTLRSPSGSKLPLRSTSSRETSKRPNRYRANPKSKLDVAVAKIVNHLPVPVDIVHASSAAAPDGRGKKEGWQDESGRYWVGHPEPKLCFCRILRSRTVMVRIGGGWQELSNYILRHYADLASQMAIGTGNSPKHTPPRQADPDSLPWISSATLATPRSRQVSPEIARLAPASARKRVESLRGTRDTSSSTGPRVRKGSTPLAPTSSLQVPPLPETPLLGMAARRRPSVGPDLGGMQQDQMIPVFFRRQDAGDNDKGRRSFSGGPSPRQSGRQGRASTSSHHG